MSTQRKQNKKRKRRDFDAQCPPNLAASRRNPHAPQILSITKAPQSPPTKRQKIIGKKRSSKKRMISPPTEANSHVTITFANINETIDAVVLPKQNVLAMNSDVLLENKGKLSIKTSDPIQNDITPQIPIDICILQTANMKTIHPRNSFRMGTSLFYCSDAERLFWSFPLRNTRRVSCQHYCCAVSKIVTRSVGIHSNKCNGKHSTSTPCIYAVCNGKPPKGIIPAKLFANYQYFQHSALTELLVGRDPNDKKFKKVENTNNSSTMYSNIKLIDDIGAPPPLSPMKTETETETATTTMDTKRRRAQNVNHSEPAPFQQNVQIDLKALSEKKEKSKANRMSSNQTDPESHDYSDLLLHSTSSVLAIGDAEKEGKDDIKKYIELLYNRKYDEMISILKHLIPDDGNHNALHNNHNDEDELNGYRLLMATALYYSTNDSSSALRFCNLIVSSSDEGDIRYYEARKIRGLIHKKLRNYKAACHDLEFISFNNPYSKTWSDTLYGMNGQSNFLENKIIAPKHAHKYRAPPLPVPAPRLNEIITTHQAYYNPIFDNGTLNIMAMNMMNNAMDISNPDAPIIFVPSKVMNHADNRTKANKLGINLNDFHMRSIVTATTNKSPIKSASSIDPALLDINYSDLQHIGVPKGFPERQTSNTSFDGSGLIALTEAAMNEYEKKENEDKDKEEEGTVLNAGDLLRDLDGFEAMKRKTTREELIESIDNIPNVSTLQKRVSTTPEPMERIRSDALLRNDSQ